MSAFNDSAVLSAMGCIALSGASMAAVGSDMPRGNAGSGHSSPQAVRATAVGPMEESLSTVQDDPNRWLCRDLRNTQTTAYERVVARQSKDSGLQPGHQGFGTVVDEEFSRSSSFGSMTEVGDPTAYPASVACKLFMTFTDTSGFSWQLEGSGTLIDARYVLTAGRCVYLHDCTVNGYPRTFDDWATEITVVPAYDGGDSPFGNAGASLLYAPSGWTSSESANYDVGLILLDRPIGALTGWLGYGYNTHCSHYTEDYTWYSRGYPADWAYNEDWPYNHAYMYSRYGHFDSCYSTNQLQVDSDSYGMIGSGAYKIMDDERYVHAVLSNGSDSSSYHRYCHLWEEMYDIVGAFLSASRADSPDLIPLNVEGPSTVGRGDDLYVSFKIHNYSPAGWSGSLTAEIRLSSDDQFDSSDTLLQTFVSSGTLDGLDTVIVGKTFEFPSGLGFGRRYLVVKINLSDANTGNNVAEGQDAWPIWVRLRL